MVHIKAEFMNAYGYFLNLNVKLTDNDIIELNNLIISMKREITKIKIHNYELCRQRKLSFINSALADQQIMCLEHDILVAEVQLSSGYKSR